MATNEITGPEENSASCEMMFSDHLNETDEEAVWERRLSTLRARDVHVRRILRLSGRKFPDFGNACAGDANKTLNMSVHLVAPVAPSILDVKRQQAGGGVGVGREAEQYLNAQI